MDIAGSALGLVGGAVDAAGTIMGANRYAAAEEAQKPYDILTAMYKAQSLRQAGDEALAASQQRAIGHTRQKEQALGKAQTLAAASGGGAGPSDTSVVNIEAGLERQGEFNKAMELFGGKSEQAKAYTEAETAAIAGVNRATARQAAADEARSSAKWKAAGSLLGAAGQAGTAYARYGSKVPFG